MVCLERHWIFPGHWTAYHADRKSDLSDLDDQALRRGISDHVVYFNGKAFSDAPEALEMGPHGISFIS